MSEPGRIPTLAEQIARSISVSMASDIAAIDQSSNDVAEYIEQRLSPIWALLYTPGVGPALERIARDGGKPKRRICKTCSGDGFVVDEQTGVGNKPCPTCS